MTHGDLPRETRTYIYSNARMIAQLPEPGNEWSVADVDIPEEAVRRLHKLLRKGILERKGKAYGVTGPGTCAHVWETEQKPYKRAVEIVEAHEENAMLPCKHNWIKNDPDVDGVRCGYCGKVHPKAAVRARMQSH